MTRSVYAAPRPAASRKWVAIFALLAFFLQSLAVQTHIHPALSPVVAKTAVQQVPAPAPLKSQDPVDQCRLCQELVHAGAFVAPTMVAVLVAPSLAAAVFAAPPSPSSRPATAFAWQSRAPPRR